ncbi:cation:dicarboxylate symporter family transporter [Helicobacter mustelae]|uniref:Putative Sodium:dicarboxylate symporter protein n=1 Tax=Helicobacter mustelae (strain ATCC 43772 / CCUG 25715 / CIP 103759 / LMG 18044 / NCTC 12198 / R85-136P) TaxID=679897 RepID=D3UHX3_HELM1|nr:putative Sodium:dicarboxylate symporter protein [Helicobacter mustelae 12198]SQH71610.1 sodium:dicarboxylate symporter protein [Helicobacter mustelae]
MGSNFLNSFLMVSKWQTLVIFAILFFVFFVLKKLQNKQVDFSIRMLVGLVAGLCFGFILEALADYPEDSKSVVWLNEARNWFGFFADAFVAFIKMLVIPIISISIIKVVIDIDKDIKISSLLSRSLFWILFTVAIAGGVGVILGYVFDLGLQTKDFVPEAKIREVKTITQILLGLIPGNIIDSMAKNNIIALVIFSFFIGFGAKSMGRAEGFEQCSLLFERFVHAVHKIIMDITLFIIRFMPYAVVCMMAEVLLSNGFGAIKTAIKFIILIYVAMVIMLVVYCVILALRGLNPFIFMKKVLPVILFSFTSRSSVSTLPITVSTLQNKVGVSSGVANFVASIGTTVGLNGCAGYFPALVAIFIANSIGVHIDVSFVVIVILMVILGSLGIAGVPGSATMAASIMLAGIGFSDQFVLLSIVLAIDPIIDMARTSSNVTGAMVAAVCTDKDLKNLNREVYYG